MSQIQKYNKKIVLKIEFDTLTKSDGTLDHSKMERMAMILSNLHNSGKHLLLVTSGAIALGTLKLKLSEPPKSLIAQQATAAVGQAELIKIYQNYFETFNQQVAQVLLTRDTIDIEERKINAVNTFNTLFEMDIIPVVNENDTVSTEDIEFDDNYPLTHNVAEMSGANMIIIRGKQDGDYFILMRGKNEAVKIENEAKLIKEIEKNLTDYNIQFFEGRSFPSNYSDIVFI